uniref:Uncharacterized protein n=1 Tax=Caenorhabditis japonica TaxID=281687 RepID=A0A8R1IGT7_CAEJA
MNQFVTPFHGVSPYALLTGFIVSVIALAWLVIYLLRPPEPATQTSSSPPPFTTRTSSSSEDTKHQKDDKFKGKRKRRFIKKEIRAMEMEEKKRIRQEKKEEAKSERAKVKKVEGKQKTLKFGTSSIEKANGVSRAMGAPVVRSIPRKRS